MLKYILSTVFFWILLISIKAQTDNCSFLHKLYNYQSGIKVYKSFDSIIHIPGFPYLKNNLIKLDLVDSTFNLSQYLKIFDKLSLKDNYKFDFLYSSAVSNRFEYSSNLKMYAHLDSSAIDKGVKAEMRRWINFTDSMIKTKTEKNKVKQSPYFEQDMQEYYSLRSRIDYKFAMIQYCLKDTLSKIYLHLQPEETKEGYFQYLILYLSEQYGLQWGASQNLQNERIICSREDLEWALNRLRNEPGYNQDTANKLLQTNTEPVVEMSDSKCFVSLIVSDIVGELWRRNYEIKLINLKFILTGKKLLIGRGAVFD